MTNSTTVSGNIHYLKDSVEPEFYYSESNNGDSYAIRTTDITPNDLRKMADHLEKVRDPDYVDVDKQVSSHITQAIRLLMAPLSSQIKTAGGEGFNCDVKCTPVKGSFAAMYTFETENGKRTLLTHNETHVGLIDEEVYHHIMFNAQNGEYTSTTVNDIDVEPYRILKVKSLGFSFEDMHKSLKKMWPNRVVWKLTVPELPTNN
ncbi:MAG: hypothetical protein HRT95_13085 [Moritella sp.]|uniref:hypothetical protein n=1 Tax=Moritella sp. TaxID=78556 RepID=UPI001DBABC34|nr:hypothetical protein [Moritella sp.]NQZ51060.1 hypothetical protein [Moritella sp.]